MSAAEPLLLEVDGMFCTSCARALQVALQRVRGVDRVTVGFATGVATVHISPSADREQVTEAVSAVAVNLGYPTRPWSFAPAGVDRGASGDALLRTRLAVGWLLGMWVMLAQLALYAAPDLAISERLLLARLAGAAATPVVFVIGWPFHLAAWRTVRARVPGMDLLVSLGTTGAWTLSILQLASGSSEVWFDAAAMLVVFLLAGRVLESGARRRGVDAVRQLLNLSPEVVRVYTEDGVQQRPAAQVQVGEMIEIPSASRLPLDGIVEGGQSTLDRAMLTGESLPVDVGPGDTVEAGCTNGAGVLRVRVTAGVGSRVLDGIAKEVRRALDQQTEHPSFAQRLAERMVPLVMGLSAMTLALSLWWSIDPRLAVLRALSVLVVTCPCALGVAAPLVDVVAIGRAAGRGILVRGPDALHRASQVDVVALDKTGTLTLGRPRVLGVDCVDSVDRAALLALAASAELGSEHPVASAIRAASKDLDPSGERQAIPGRGVLWTVGETRIQVGARRWFSGLPLTESEHGTEVWVVRDGCALGRILLADTVRPDAARLVRALRGEGYQLRLWSGDLAAPVRAVALAVGLRADEIAWGLDPLDKAERIRALEREDQRVAFVGDGLNDAPGLAAASVGIAVVDAADSARAAAGVVLRSGGLDQVSTLLTLAREAQRRVRGGVAWALVYNAVAVPLAMLGLFGPHWAALAMAVSSLSVTVNAVRPSRISADQYALDGTPTSSVCRMPSG